MRSDRWLARGAVLAYLAAVAVASWGVVAARGLGAAVAGLLSVLLLGVVAQAVVLTGLRRPVVVGAAVALGLVVFVAWQVLDQPVVAGLTPALAGIAADLHVEWRSSRVVAAAPATAAPVRPVPAGAVLVVNPRSGDGTAERVGLVDAARALGIEVRVLGDGEDPAEVAAAAVQDGATVLGIAGGDGSLAAVAEVAAAHDVAMVVVPAGTRNHLALDLGLDRDDPLAALAAFDGGEERRIDLAEVNGHVFVNTVSLGVYAALVDQDGYREAKLATLLEAVPDLWADGGPWFDLALDVPDHGRLDEVALLQVSNDAYVLAGDVFRREALDDGELGVITVDPDRLRDLVALTALTVAGRPEASSVLWSWSTPTLEVGSGQEQVVAGIDGERVELRPPLRFSVRRGALRVLVPRGALVGLGEQHASSPPHTDLLSAALGLGGPDA